MVKNVYNLDQVTRIEVTRKALTDDFVFVKGESYWIKHFNTKAGFRYKSIVLENAIYTKEELEADTFYGRRYAVEGLDVYRKPKITLYFSDGSEKNLYFNTDDEAQCRAAELKDGLTNIHLELFKS